jgi:poly(3-hydroxybutyrate) depolymerase
VSVVNYTKTHYDVDPSRVVLSGFSSGAMMTNVMAAEYPDVFAAGAAFSGVPATCFGETGTQATVEGISVAGVGRSLGSPAPAARPIVRSAVGPADSP